MWLQNIIQDHAQNIGISEAQSHELAITLLPALEKYRQVIMPTYIDDGMWARACENETNCDYQTAAALYRAFVKDYTERK